MMCLRMSRHMGHGVLGYGDRCIDKKVDESVKIPESNSSTHSLSLTSPAAEAR